MKAPKQQLKKLKTKQVFGFKKEQLTIGILGGETTYTTGIICQK